MIARTAKAEAARLTAATAPSADESLLDFVERIGAPHLKRPDHLAPLAAKFEEALTRPVRCVISVPPQHGKSTLVFHAIPWWLQRRPSWPIVYVTYASEFSRTQMKIARPIIDRAGIPIRSNADTIQEWFTEDGGSLYATGIGGPLTGRPVKILVVDDPTKNWQEAQSLTIRDNIHQWLQSTALTRLHPESSVFLVQTRWHEDDEAGRLAKAGWEVVNLPAVGNDNAALWPAERPLEFLEQQRAQVGAWLFEALYQGRPRPREGSLFRADGVRYYRDVPHGLRYGAGVDLAYTAKTHADYSVLAVLGVTGGKEPEYYVLDVIRRQVKAEEFALVLRGHQERRPGVTPRWAVGGQERAVGESLQREFKLRLNMVPALGDKYARALPVSAQWNAGKFLLPEGAPWVAPFLDELLEFSGVGDAHDDQVDAFASAFDALPKIAAGTPVVETFLPERKARWGNHF